MIAYAAAFMLMFAAPSVTLGQIADTSTTLTSTGSVGNYTFTATVKSGSSAAGGPAGTINFTDQTTGATLAQSTLGTPTASAGNFISTASLTLADTASCYNIFGQVLAVDANGDGMLDMVFPHTLQCSYATGNSATDDILIFPGNGDGTFGSAITHTIPIPSNTIAVTRGIGTGNFGSSSGLPGFVQVSLGSGGQVIVMKDNQGTFTPAIPLTSATGPVAVGPNSAWVAVATFDGMSAGVNIYSNTAGSLSLASSIPVGTPNNILAVTKYGLVVGSCVGSQGTLSILTGSAANMQISKSITLSACPVSIGVGSFRGSNTSDLMVNEQGDNVPSQLVLLEDDGSGNYTPQTGIPEYFAAMTDIATGDLNGDGKLDFAINDQADKMVSLYYGNGDGTFQAPINLSIPGIAAGLAVGSFASNEFGVAVSEASNGGYHAGYDVLQSTPAGSAATATAISIFISGTGTHAVVATYSGNTNYMNSISNTVNLNAGLVPTTLVLTASPSTAVSGQSIAFTATLSPYNLSAYAMATGPVLFYNGTQSQPFGIATASSGVARFSTSALPVGNNSVKATFESYANFGASDSNSVAVTVLAAGPQASLSPSSLSFTGVNVGTASSAQTVTLSNVSTSPLSITSIATSGDFSETNNCGSSLASASICSISVTFTPSASGARSGTLTVTDNASGSPQTTALTGTGETISLTAPSSSLVIPSPGGSATYPITVASLNNFSGAVNLTCAVSYLGSGTASYPPICSLNPITVQLMGGSSLTSTLTVNTTGSTAANIRPSLRAIGFALAGPFLLILIPCRKNRVRLLGLLFAATLAGLVGCSGSSGGGSSPSPQTTAGNYNVVVTATSGSVKSSITILLTLQ